MAQWSNAVVTLAGVEMLNQVVEGKRLILDYAAGGSGVVDVASLLLQSGLKNQKQQFEIVGVSKAESGRKIHVMITNTELAQGYTLNQLGIWAHIDEAAPRLLCILQDSEGIKIPAASELLDFALDFYAAIAISSDAQIELSVDPSALVSLSTLQEALANYIQLDSAGKIPDDVLPDMDFIPKTDRGKAGGVASLGADGKIPLEQLVIDTALSAISDNPVQNKIVQAAIEAINTALGGKAASNHGHTLASLGAAAANHSHTAAQVGAATANHSHTAAQVGAAASNHTHTAAALGISLQSLGGCRIVTGQYTGDNVVRVQTNTGTGGFITLDTVPTVVPNYITFAGGQFINLGARPKAILLAYNGENRYYGNDYVNLVIPNNQEVIWNPDYHVSRGLSGYYNNGSTAYRFFRLLEFADNGFYVGGSNTIQNTASLPFNKSGVIYNYMAII